MIIEVIREVKKYTHKYSDNCICQECNDRFLNALLKVLDKKPTKTKGK